MRESEKLYPFAAIVGQDDLKLCLILCAIDQSIGGVLIRGDKGTAKSTAARGLAKLLSHIEVAYDPKSDAFDPYNQNLVDAILHASSSQHINKPYTENREIPTPFVDLPIGATEDRVLGSIDFSATLQQGGQRVFAPGLLAAANRGILYIDEVNLLPAHLVDVLLDAAAMGSNTVQREGVSMSHPAKFMLIGTMNPEEGDLRPQLLDRFGLMVDVVAPTDATARAEVVRQRISFERDAANFRAQCEEAETKLTLRIQAAKDCLSEVILAENLLLLISQICTEFKIGSLRADITLYKTATALAAWEGRMAVEAEDIRRAANWVLAHRRRRQPFESPMDQQDMNDKMEQLVKDSQKDQDQNNQDTEDSDDRQDPAGSSSAPNEDEPSSETDSNDNNDKNASGDQMQTFTASKPGQIKQLKLGKQQKGQAGTGRRNQVMNTPQKGHYVRSMPTDKPIDIALDATLRAAAANGLHADTGQPIIRPENWRKKVRNSSTDTLILFVVDASGSMAARQRMEAVKGAVLALLTDAYQQRDRVGLIAFRGLKAEMLLQPTKSVELAEQKLQRLPTGGRTPLSHALSLTYETVQRLIQNESEQAILLVVLSDGKGNTLLPDSAQGDPWAQTQHVAAQLAALSIPTLMLDTETGHVRIGRGRELAKLLHADYLLLEELSSDKLVHTIRQAVVG